MRVRDVIDARTETYGRVLEEAAAVVQAGGTVIFPTDTVYGIGCDPYNAAAIAQIYGAKERPAHKPLSLHLGSLAEFLEYVADYRDVQAVARRLMPGPVTLIIPKPAFISAEVTSGLPTLGFRVPDDALCSAILDRCGPIAATSANVSGERAYFGNGNWEELPPADLLIENGPTRYGRDSTVIDLTGRNPVVLREGVISIERITQLVGSVGHHDWSIRKRQ